MKKLLSFVVLALAIFLQQLSTFAAVTPAFYKRHMEEGFKRDILVPLNDGTTSDTAYISNINGTDYVIYKGRSVYMHPVVLNIDEQKAFKDYDYIKAGDYYMARRYRVDVGPPDARENDLEIFDLNFQLVKKFDFGGGAFVCDMSYVDGKYYCTYGEYYIPTTNDDGSITDKHLSPYQARFTHNPMHRYITVMSVDMENWVELSDVQKISWRERIPRTGLKTDMIGNKIAFPGSDFFSVDYEDGIQKEYMNMLGDWFLKRDTNGDFYLSNDNVYFVKIDVVDELKEKYGIYKLNNDSVYYVYEYDEYIIIDLGNEPQCRIYIPKNEVYAELEALKNATYVKLNNEILGFEQAPVVENDRTLVPMRFLFEKLGADVDWNEATETATVVKDGETISFQIGNESAKVNGSIQLMDVPAKLENDKTMVPLRFLSENLGYNVEWDEATRMVTITTE